MLNVSSMFCLPPFLIFFLWISSFSIFLSNSWRFCFRLRLTSQKMIQERGNWTRRKGIITNIIISRFRVRTPYARFGSCPCQFILSCWAPICIQGKDPCGKLELDVEKRPRKLKNIISHNFFMLFLMRRTRSFTKRIHEGKMIQKSKTISQILSSFG